MGITNNRSDNGFRTYTRVIEMVLMGTGLRCNELVKLKVKNLIIDNEKVVGIRVETGSKGDRPRYVEVRKEYCKPIL